jgi:hypothetical protein
MEETIGLAQCLLETKSTHMEISWKKEIID